MPNTARISKQDESQHLADLIHIGLQMRFAQKYWHEHFGSAARLQKQRWEKKFDDKLSALGITAHMDIQSVKEIKP